MPAPGGGPDVIIGRACQRDVEVPVGEALGQSVTPLHDRDGIIEISVEIQRIKFRQEIDLGVEESVEVDVHHGGSSLAARPVHTGQHEGRGVDRALDVHPQRNPFGQGRLSGTEGSGEHYHVAGTQLPAELFTESDGLRDRRQFRGTAVDLRAHPEVSHGLGLSFGARTRPSERGSPSPRDERGRR